MTAVADPRLLVERGGRVVGKEELLREVWPDTFVEEATLAIPGDPPPPQPAASSDNAMPTTTAARIKGRRQGMSRTVRRASIRRVARKRCLSAAAQR